jgi:hypothetical protein
VGVNTLALRDNQVQKSKSAQTFQFQGNGVSCEKSIEAMVHLSWLYWTPSNIIIPKRNHRLVLAIIGAQVSFSATSGAHKTA